MGYIWALLNYLKTEKAKRDMMDYLRAGLVIGSVMAVLRIMLDFLLP